MYQCAYSIKSIQNQAGKCIYKIYIYYQVKTNSSDENHFSLPPYISDGLLKVGHEGGAEIMSYQFGEDHPIQANYISIGIHTGWDHVGNWKLCGKLSFLSGIYGTYNNLSCINPRYKGIELQCVEYDMEYSISFTAGRAEEKVF